MIFSRRIFGGLALGALATACAPRAASADPTAVGGVRLGVCVGSYRDIPRTGDQMSYMAALADACAQSGAGLIEYHNSQIEPDTRLYRRAGPGEPPLPELTPAEFEALREERRQWRLQTPVSYYEEIRRINEAAGLTPYSYSCNLTNDLTDEEIESVFVATRALGAVNISTNAAQVGMATRVAPFAERHQMDVAFHNHANSDDPNEIGSEASFERVLEASHYCKANLDIGHYVAGNGDPIAFLERHHARTTHLHFKDRSPDRGRNMPWGMGETPLAEVLRLIQTNGWDIPCLVEYEYYGYPGTGGSIEENRRCLEFMRDVLTQA